MSLDQLGELRLARGVALSHRISLSLVLLMLASSILAILPPPLLESDDNVLHSARAQPCGGNICINEVMPNPAGYDDAAWPGGEWFEITNVGTSAVSILGWYAENSNGKQLTFDSISIVGYNSSDSASWNLQAGDYMVIARNASANFYMTNTADTLRLYDTTGTFSDEASWSSAQSGTSYVEDPADAYADWVSSAGPTPGSNNSGAQPPVYYGGDLQISEVMPNPWPSYDNESWPGGEWVEVYNNGSTAFDVSGWNLSDSAGNIITLNEDHMVGYDPADSSTWTLEAGEYGIVAINSSSSYGVLNNGQEELFLTWPNGTISEKVSWSKAHSGMSLVKDSAGNMVTAVFPTQGEANAAPIDSIINASSDISFNEVMPNSSADGQVFAAGGEWLELYNDGNANKDLTGWSVIDGMGNVTLLDGSLEGTGTNIESKSYRLLQFVGDTTLWNDFNHLCLRDPSGHIVDVLHWDDDHGQNISLVRQQNIEDAWLPSAYETPGQENPSGGVSGEAEILINEVMPNPHGNDTSVWPDGEWVELLNIGNESVDLAGWKLQAGGYKNFALTAERLYDRNNTTLEAGGYALVMSNGSSTFYLRNSNGDSLALINAQENVMHSILWSSNVSEGESLVAHPSSPESEWIQSMWPTPGAPNPEFGNYTGSTDLLLNEVLPHCYDDSVEPVDDWVELHNHGSEIINVSRWSMIDKDGDSLLIRHDRIWNVSADSPDATLVQPGEYIVILAPVWFVSGYGDSIELRDPNDVSRQSIQWTVTTDCRTLGPDLDDSSAEWQPLLWPTPGLENPDPDDYNFETDVLFTRLMYDETSYTDRNNEFFELTNLGESTVNLANHIIRRTKVGGDTYDARITSLILDAGESIIISPDAASLRQDSGMDATSANSVMNTSVYLTNSGGALQLIAPDGSVTDAVVYGNADPTIEGWTGAALSEPNGSSSGLIMIRGDGCSNIPDSNTSADWMVRWSRIGASNICSTPTFSSSGSITPTVSPNGSLAQIIEWIGSAQSSLHVHMYQISSPEISFALRQAASNGVEVTVVLDEGDTWWTDYTLRNHRGYASDLAASGATVYWFGEPDYSGAPYGPYSYLHSKVAVKDDSSVWLGSGNWGRSTLPLDDSAGNVDWGVIIDSADVASLVLERLLWDEDPAKMHIKEYDSTSSTQGTPSGWSTPAPADETPSLPDSVFTTSGQIEGRLLTCPDDCMEGLVWLIDQADEELLLSLQYLDMDWYWGWGPSPLLEALSNAAERGVAVRMVINGYYYDDEIQEAVDQFNNIWNATNGWDAAAVIMADSDEVSKNHNKGVIVDGQLTLFSSVNWGANAVIRNREMGVIIDSEEIASHMRMHWMNDWNRLNDSADTDGDGLPDYWEVQYGLNRTSPYSTSGIFGEEGDDPDGDGISNLDEFRYWGNPLSADTDGDCLSDAYEISLAQSNSVGVSQDIIEANIREAMTKNDFDKNGVDDGQQWDCGAAAGPDSDSDGIEDSLDRCPGTSIGHVVNSHGCSAEQRTADDLDDDGVENELDNCPDTPVSEIAIGTGGASVAKESYRGCSPSQLDEDGDGIFDELDDCLETPADESVNINGCSAEQLADKAKANSNDAEEGIAGTVFTIVMISSGILLGGWLLINALQKKGEEELLAQSLGMASSMDELDQTSLPVLDSSTSAMPVLDGSATGPPALDMSQFPGWTQETVQTYLDQGWTTEQLKEWYDNASK